MPTGALFPLADEGSAAVEYSFLVVAIAAVTVVVIFTVGQFSQATYDDTCDSLSAEITTDDATSCP